MSNQEQLRSRIVQQRHATRNRQQSLLSRAAAEVGLDPSDIGVGTRIQGKLGADAESAYGRSRSALS